MNFFKRLLGLNREIDPAEEMSKLDFTIYLKRGNEEFITPEISILHEEKEIGKAENGILRFKIGCNYGLFYSEPKDGFQPFEIITEPLTLKGIYFEKIDGKLIEQEFETFESLTFGFSLHALASPRSDYCFFEYCDPMLEISA